jgi:hypothetical protein
MSEEWDICVCVSACVCVGGGEDMCTLQPIFPQLYKNDQFSLKFLPVVQDVQMPEQYVSCKHNQY